MFQLNPIIYRMRYPIMSLSLFWWVFSCHLGIESCLTEGTLVTTPDGALPIEELKIGNKIISYDTQNKTLVTNIVTKIKTSETKTTIKIILNNGKKIEGTEEHPIYLPEKNNYIKMGNLKKGEKLLIENSELITIKNIYSNHYHAPIKVYDISVSPLFHNYFAGNVLVHNKIFYIDFDNQDLSGQDLSGQDLSGRYFRGANLQNANLSNASLCGANLQNANLQNANLNGAWFQHTRLSDANLRYANLRYANLRYADLRYANLRYANLTNADCSYTLINGIMTNGALGITSSTFKGARP